MTNDHGEEEIWKPVPGYPEIEASSLGRIKTLPRIVIARHYRGGTRRMNIRERILKNALHPKGRYKTCIYHNRRAENIFTHRLIALAFLGKPNDPTLTVNHIDGNKINNRPENLEWVSNVENIRLFILSGKNPKGDTHHRTKITSDKEAIFLDMLKNGCSNKEIGSYFGVSKTTVKHHKKRLKPFREVLDDEQG